MWRGMNPQSQPSGRKRGVIAAGLQKGKRGQTLGRPRVEAVGTALEGA
jgi:hypothetical protein